MDRDAIARMRQRENATDVEAPFVRQLGLCAEKYGYLTNPCHEQYIHGIRAQS